MASSPPPPPPPPPSAPVSPAVQQKQQTLQQPYENPLLRPIALVVTPLALVGLCLPPRKLDMRAALLGGVTLWGTNRLAYDYTGKSFMQRFSSRVGGIFSMELPERAQATQTRLREEKVRRETLRALRDEMIRSGAAPAPVGGSSNGNGDSLRGWTDDQKRALLEAYARRTGGEQPVQWNKSVGQEGEGSGKEKGILQRVWMGDAPPDWKEKRDQREREALQEGGGGYLGLITDQIAEVFGVGKKKNDGDDAKGENTSVNDGAKKP